MKAKPLASAMTYWAGIDLAKETFQIAIWGHQEFPEMEVRSFPRKRKEMKRVLKWLRDKAPAGAPLAVIMESTGTFAEEVGSWLLKLDPTLRIAIVNPFRVFPAELPDFRQAACYRSWPVSARP
jgi:hypothetical protein